MKAANLKAQLAYGSRRDVSYPQDRLEQLRRDYYAARGAENATKAIRDAGPLTPEQAQELTQIINETTTQETNNVS
jgi:hypothetical protein